MFCFYAAMSRPFLMQLISHLFIFIRDESPSFIVLINSLASIIIIIIIKTSLTTQTTIATTAFVGSTTIKEGGCDQIVVVTKRLLNGAASEASL